MNFFLNIWLRKKYTLTFTVACMMISKQYAAPRTLNLQESSYRNPLKKKCEVQMYYNRWLQQLKTECIIFAKTSPYFNAYNKSTYNGGMTHQRRYNSLATKNHVISCDNSIFNNKEDRPLVLIYRYYMQQTCHLLQLIMHPDVPSLIGLKLSIWI